jgi:hypothetical protein
MWERARMVGAALAASVLALAVTPGAGAAQAEAEPPAPAAEVHLVPTLGGASVDATAAAADAGITLVEDPGPLGTAAATVTTLTLNGGAMTVVPGSTGNVLQMGGSGFTPSSMFLFLGAYEDLTITNYTYTSPTQASVTFDVPSNAKGIAFLFTREPAEASYTPIVALQVYIGTGAFFPLTTPARILDSRTGIGGHSAPLDANATWRIPVAGQNGIPLTATAVSLNLTAIGAAGGGFLSLYPAGGTRPDVSSVNFGGGHKVVPNHVIVPLGQDGALDLFSGAGDAVHALIDIDGYYSGQDVPGGRLYWDSSPTRVLDLRSLNVAIPAGTTMTLPVPGPPGSGLTVGDVADINVTITNQTGVGFATVYPAGETTPNASTHNWVGPFQDTANRAAVRIGPGGGVNVTNGSTGSIQVIIDYFGSWNDVVGYRFFSVAPTRVVDTRATSPLFTGETRWLDTTGWVNVSPRPWLLVGNLTGDQPTSATYFQLWTDAAGLPPQPSNLNLQSGETRANSFILPNAFGGDQVNLRNAFGAAHAILDVFGYFDD